jgi:hypothetical protein
MERVRREFEESRHLSATNNDESHHDIYRDVNTDSNNEAVLNYLQVMMTKLNKIESKIAAVETKVSTV